MVEKPALEPSAGPTFYDDDAVFATYMARRLREGNPNDTLEKPIIVELLGELAHQRMLDLGCGDAAFGREALGQQCQSYVGIDGSRNMVALAQKNLQNTPGEAIHATLETWDYPPATFDVALSRLALHYIEDLEAVFRLVHRTLVVGGRFVFSVEHPVITSCDRGWQGAGPRQDWVVDDYFLTGRRVTEWMGGQVVKYHRTVENYFLGLQQAGFLVEAVRESQPRREHFADEENYRRRQRIPLFLILAARKF